MPKTQKEINSNLLIAIYQNLQTAIQSINNVLDKVKDSRLKKELKHQFKEYDAFIERCEDLAQKEDIKLQENGFFKKAKMWISVNMATMLNKSNRKIASINIVGSTMGVIDLISVISDCKSGDKELVNFGKEVLKYEEENVEKLKPYILFENNKPKSEIFEKGKENSNVVVQKGGNNKQQNSTTLKSANKTTNKISSKTINKTDNKSTNKTASQTNKKAGNGSKKTTTSGLKNGHSKETKEENSTNQANKKEENA